VFATRLTDATARVLFPVREYALRRVVAKNAWISSNSGVALMYFVCPPHLWIWHIQEKALFCSIMLQSFA
jgi:hypothetical protein